MQRCNVVIIISVALEQGFSNITSAMHFRLGLDTLKIEDGTTCERMCEKVSSFLQFCSLTSFCLCFKTCFFFLGVALRDLPHWQARAPTYFDGQDIQHIFLPRELAGYSQGIGIRSIYTLARIYEVPYASFMSFWVAQRYG